MKMAEVSRALLLFFVAASIGGIAVKLSTRPESSADHPPTWSSSSDRAVNDRLDVYYFHATTRCPTCTSIETQTKSAIRGNFAKQIDDGSVTWQSLSYEEPENQQYVEKFALFAPTVVLVRTRADRELEWKELDRVWELVDDPNAFRNYVLQEAESALSQESPGPNRAEDR